MKCLGMFLTCKILKKNEVPFKQRSFEDSIDTFFSLFDADLLLMWMNTFKHGDCFYRTSCPVLPIVLIILQGECIIPRTGNKEPNSLEPYLEVLVDELLT